MLGHPIGGGAAQEDGIVVQLIPAAGASGFLGIEQMVAGDS